MTADRGFAAAGPTSTLSFLEGSSSSESSPEPSCFRFDAVATRGFSFDDDESSEGSESSGLALTCVVLAHNPDLVPVVGLGSEEEVAMAEAIAIVRARRF